MKQLMLSFLVLLGNLGFAQDNQELFEVEYELNGKQNQSYAYTVENCSQNTIYNTWQNWVLNKAGNFSILKKHEANNLQFKNSDDRYKVILSIVEDSPTQFTIINTLTDQNGMSFSNSNPDFNEIYEKLRDLSYQSRKACVRTALKGANESLIRLTKENVAIQSKKGTSIKSYLKSSNELLKLENKQALLVDKLDLLENQLERATDDKQIDQLMKKKNKIVSKATGLETSIQSLVVKIATAEEQNRVLDQKVEEINNLYKSQRINLESLKSKFIAIKR